MSTSQDHSVTWKNVPTRTTTAGGVEFAYRELGRDNPGTPVVFLVHLAAVMDNWDPRVIDGFAAKHRVVVFDNRGVAPPVAHRRVPSSRWPRTRSPSSGYGLRAGRPLRVFDGRDDRSGNRADGAEARTQDDHHGDRAGWRRRHQQGCPRHLPRYGPRLALPPRPQTVPVLHQDAQRNPRWQGVPGAITRAF